MAINVLLLTNRFQLLDENSNLFSSATYIAIDDISPSTISYKYVGFPMTTAAEVRASAFGGGVPTTQTVSQISVRVKLRTGLVVEIPLGQVTNEPTWANTQAGYEIAEAAIYAAFP